MRRTFLAAVLALAAPALAGSADLFVVDPAHSDVSFTVRHLVSKVGGQFRDFEGAIAVDRARPEASSVEFTVQAASIDTRHADRDKHLRTADFLDAEKHPLVTFKSTKVTARGSDRYDVTGVLSLRGQQKEITLPVTFMGFVKDPWGNDKAGFEATYVLNRKDWGMVWNKALDNGGVILGDEVTLAFNLEAAKKKEAASR
ncbi:MAG TPA: YceI family protein [Vicinamibacteria bacterium]|jgi:polyisoprenoid-binding protein YceI